MNPTQLAKRVANLAMRGAVAPLVALYRLETSLLPEQRRDTVFQAFSQVLSALPGYSGQFVRRAFYGEVLPECHPASCINWGTVFSSRDVSLGEGVYVGARCMIGRARLEKHATLGSNIDVLSGKKQHNFDDPDVPVQQQGGVFERVTLGENCWIGNSSVIMADVGARAIVAAGSVVVHPVPPDTIVGGNPAKVIRARNAGDAARAGRNGGGASSSSASSSSEVAS